jgi:hypothetical protein
MSDDSVEYLRSVYFEEERQILLRFQFIEEGIKMYLGLCCWIIENRLNKIIPFEYSYKDFRRYPLGKLISRFQMLNGNTELIVNLKSLVETRNDSAHKSFLLTEQECNDPNYLSALIDESKRIRTKVQEALDSLLSELEKVERIKNQLGKNVSAA